MSRALAFKLIALLATATLLGIAVLPAFAGGWAVVTLDSLPTNVVAAQPVEIGFMVRQHGQTLLPGLRPQIRLARAGLTGSTLTLTAVEDSKKLGHYTAQLTIPSAGEWNWTIDTFGAFKQPMPPLTVLAMSPSAAAPAVSTPSSVILQVIGFVGLVGVLGGLLAVWRTRRPLAGVATVGALTLALVGFAAAARQPVAVAAPEEPATATSLADTGRALFLAKGCLICHQLNAVNEYRAGFADFSVGPNLSTYRLSPDYLSKWLFKPDAVKPKTPMPTLGLSGPEIDALVAFLDENMGK